MIQTTQKTATLLLIVFTALLCGDSLKVGVKNFPPFSVFSQDKWTGADIELIDHFGKIHNLTIQYIPFQNVQDLLVAVKKNQVDVALGGITINAERERQLDFTHTYLKSSLGVAHLKPKEQTFLTRLATFFKSGFSSILWTMLGFILLCAHLIWFSEKGKDAFSDKYFPGIMEGAWWTIVTMSTVGYGDFVPKKWFGRWVGMFVIITGIAFFSLVVAELSASFAASTLRQQEFSREDILNGKIATIKGTTSSQFLQERAIPFEWVNSVDQGLQHLKAKKAEFLLYDLPVLRKATQKYKGIMVANHTFSSQYYGWALPPNSPKKEIFNLFLLESLESNLVEQIFIKWFDSES